MLTDRYGNELSTTSLAAIDAYDEGLELYLAGQYGADLAFARAAEEDPSFALAHAALARSYHAVGRGADVAAPLGQARSLAAGLTAREAAHLSILGHVMEGRGAQAYQEIRSHVASHPRDTLAVQPCAGVFSLIGFSGREGREAESLAFFSTLAPAYGDDWWFLSVLGFAQVETGQLAAGEATLQKSYDGNPLNANAAHYTAHFHYENGDRDNGRAFIHDWRSDYDKRSILHCHISWHEALWALEAGDMDGAWAIIDADVRPGGAWGPPLNVLTDMAAFLLRAEFAGAPRRDDLWREVSDYAARFFATPGISFADAHAALAHALAGNDEALATLAETSAGWAADIVNALSHVYKAYRDGDWAAVIAGLVPAIATHERIGGSRAQRDFMEFTLVNALLKQGRLEEAHQMLAMRRPHIADGHFLAGLNG